MVIKFEIDSKGEFCIFIRMFRHMVYFWVEYLEFLERRLTEVLYKFLFA